LPAFLLILGLSYVYVTYGAVTWVSGIFYGLSAAVIGIVSAAVIRIGSRALRNPVMYAVAGVAFLAIFLFHVPFPLIVLAGGLLGLLAGQRWPETFEIGQAHGDETEGTAISDEGSAGKHTEISARRSVKVLLIGLAAWFVPLILVAVWAGRGDVLTQQAWFFSKAAVVTFGGAYAVLAYINQAAVATYGWLLPAQMVAGLGLAESTPGPLIMVTEFVGFVGAYQHPGGLEPVLAGVLGAMVVTWATFAPCFLWIFLGAPFIEHLRTNVRLTHALTTITAAIVGVVLNLALAFGIQTLFKQVRDVHVFGGPVPVPVWSSVDWFAVAVAVISFVGLWKFRWKVIPVVVASAAAGLLYKVLV
jgi:chromate transporter